MLTWIRCPSAAASSADKGPIMPSSGSWQFRSLAKPTCFFDQGIKEYTQLVANRPSNLGSAEPLEVSGLRKCVIVPSRVVSCFMPIVESRPTQHKILETFGPSPSFFADFSHRWVCHRPSKNLPTKRSR